MEHARGNQEIPTIPTTGRGAEKMRKIKENLQTAFLEIFSKKQDRRESNFSSWLQAMRANKNDRRKKCFTFCPVLDPAAGFFSLWASCETKLWTFSKNKNRTQIISGVQHREADVNTDRKPSSFPRSAFIGSPWLSLLWLDDRDVADITTGTPETGLVSLFPLCLTSYIYSPLNVKKQRGFTESVSSADVKVKAGFKLSPPTCPFLVCHLHHLHLLTSLHHLMTRCCLTVSSAHYLHQLCLLSKLFPSLLSAVFPSKHLRLNLSHLLVFDWLLSVLLLLLCCVVCWRCWSHREALRD